MTELLRVAESPEFVTQYGLTFIECSSSEKFKPLKFLFGNQWITVEPKDYIWDALGDGRTCILLVMSNSYEFALFGQPTYHGYYTHHDMDGARVGFAPLMNSGQKALFAGETPTNSIMNAGQSESWYKWFVIVYGLVCIVIYILVLYPLMSDRWENSDDSNNTIGAATFSYFFICYLLYIYAIGPALGIPTVNVFQ